jgi:magnesium chelatase family protein
MFLLPLSSDFFDCSPHGCPCGFYGDPHKECTCSPIQIQKYRAKLSSPLLEGIGINIEVPTVKYRELSSEAAGESSSDIRKRVNRARGIQKVDSKEQGSIQTLK